MEKIRKIYPVLFLTIFIFFLLSGVAFAQGKGLEIQYPQVPGAETPTTIKTPLPQYVRYIFNFSIWISGLIAFGALIYGGVRYLTSAGNPSVMDDAKDQMFAGILGLIILLSSYLLLATLNPQLLVLKADLSALAPPGETSGVYLCKDSSTTTGCAIYGTNSDTLSPEIDDKATYIRFKNTENVTYGAVLHEKKARQGTCKVFLSDGPVELPSGAPSSITVFQRAMAGSPGEGVTLYECENYEVSGNACKKWGPFQNTNGSINTDYPAEQVLGRWGRSIKINEEGKYLAVLFQGANGTQKCEVFTQNDPSLASNYIGDCGLSHNLGCFTSIMVLPINK